MVKNKNEIIAIFIRFLKEENVYRKYMVNYYKLNNDYNSSKKIKLDSFLYNHRFELLIALAFNWKYSNEGWCYWDNIDYKWIKKYQKTIIKR